MDQVIKKVVFVFRYTGIFILRQEIAFQLDTPAEPFVCAGTTVIGSHSGTGENGFFKTVQAQQVCSSCSKPEQKDKNKNKK